MSSDFGANITSLSVPLRVYQNKLDSLLDLSKQRHIGSDFAPYLILASSPAGSSPVAGPL